MLAGLLQLLQNIQPSFWLALGIFGAVFTVVLIIWVARGVELKWWGILAIVIFITTASFSFSAFPDSLKTEAGFLSVLGGAVLAVAALTFGLGQIVSPKRKPEPTPPPLPTPPNITITLPPLPPQVLEDFTPAPRAETYIPRGKIEQDVRDRLSARGLAAIVGVTAPGGTGKTELALRASQELEASTGLKRLWLDVGEKSLEEIVADMALSLGVTFGPTDTTEGKLRQIHSQLKDKPRLVVFDDVRQQNSKYLPQLLPPRPPNAVLVTSRIKQLEGVPLTGTFELDALTPDQAIKLLQVELGPEVVEAERSVAENLAQRVAYNALALDIAARRIKLLGTVPQPIKLFYDSLKNLREFTVESNASDQSRLNLFAVLGLSYESLTGADQRRLRWLAAFAPSGFSPAAAAQVWGDEEAEASRALTRLLNLNLLKVVAAPQLRYRLHDLIDEYAADKLTTEKETEAARTAHAQWLVALFEKHYTDNMSNAPEVALELDNLRYSTQWAATLAKGDALGLLATKPRNWLYNIFRINEDWESWLKRALQLEIGERGTKATVLQAIGDVQAFRKENDAALASYQQAFELFQAVGDRLGQANVYWSRGKLLLFSENPQQALAELQQAVDLYETIGNFSGAANVYFFLGQVFANNGDFKNGIALVEKALELGRRIDPKHPVTVHIQNTLAEIQKRASSTESNP